MSPEIELKLRLADPQALRARLGALGAAACGRVLETNHIFDTPDGRLRRADCGLRVRTVQALDHQSAAESASGGVLTFKGPRTAAVFKVREEIETAVGDAAALIVILGRVGFQEVVVFEKRRETWHLAGCEVTLDELPRLGWFAEIEGPDGATIEAVRNRLGLSAATAVRETYIELAAAHGAAAPDGPRELRFNDGGPSAGA